MLGTYLHYGVARIGRIYSFVQSFRGYNSCGWQLLNSEPSFMPTMEFPGRYDSLEKIAITVQQAAQELGLDSCAAYAVETAVDEACSNIIEHAYGGENKGIIKLTYKVVGNELIIVLIDSGKKFNPQKISNPNLTAPLKDRQAHGLGLYFMRQWMDEVRFDRVEGHNVLTMIKRKGHSS